MKGVIDSIMGLRVVDIFGLLASLAQIVIAFAAIVIAVKQDKEQKEREKQREIEKQEKEKRDSRRTQLCEQSINTLKVDIDENDDYKNAITKYMILLEAKTKEFESKWKQVTAANDKGLSIKSLLGNQVGLLTMSQTGRDILMANYSEQNKVQINSLIKEFEENNKICIEQSNLIIGDITELNKTFVEVKPAFEKYYNKCEEVLRVLLENSEIMSYTTSRLLFEFIENLELLKSSHNSIVTSFEIVLKINTDNDINSFVEFYKSHLSSINNYNNSFNKMNSVYEKMKYSLKDNG